MSDYKTILESDQLLRASYYVQFPIISGAYPKLLRRLMSYLPRKFGDGWKWLCRISEIKHFLMKQFSDNSELFDSPR